MAIKVLIVDDHGLFRAGLRALLDNKLDFEVLGEAADGETAVNLACDLEPDIVLMDISMPKMRGSEATRRIKEICPNIHILALTVHEDDGMLREMIRAGASGYIIKRAVESELINAIGAVMQGHMYIHPTMTRSLFKEIIPQNNSRIEDPDSLTPREIAVLKLLARGYTNREIAQELSISVRTVEGHRSGLINKRGFSRRVEFVTFAEDHGYIDRK